MFSPEELGQLYVHEIRLANDNEAVVVYSAESKPYTAGVAVGTAIWKDNKAIRCGYHNSQMNSAYLNCGPIYRGAASSYYITAGSSGVSASSLPPFNIGTDTVKPLKDI